MSYDIDYLDDIDEDSQYRRRQPKRAFDFHCGLGQIAVSTPLSLRQVRRARASHQPLVVRVPHAHMVEDGSYKGIVTNGPEDLEVTLSLWQYQPDTGEDFKNDAYQGVGRVFPISCDGDNVEHPKVNFLVFDPERAAWYLSCGGLKYCWWCQSDQECDYDMRVAGMDTLVYPRYDDYDDDF